jgi:putative glutathione S-transferase
VSAPAYKAASRRVGELIDGVWVTNAMDSVIKDGVLHRPPSIFRNWVTADETAPAGARGYKAEAGRYHLYVSLACPWAHRTLIMRGLKGLAGMISVSVVNWLMAEDGWTFAPGEGVIPDTINGADKLRDIYLLADPHCTSRVTVPVLWDNAGSIGGCHAMTISSETR